MSRILLATTNPAKIDRLKLIFFELQQKFKFLPEIKIFTPQELGLENLKIPETGKNEQENAYLKAKGFWMALSDTEKMPCLALDTGFYLEGVEPDEQPSVSVRGASGGGDFFSAQGDQKMIDYYKKLCGKYGGEIQGYYLDAFCLFCGHVSSVDDGAELVKSFDLSRTQKSDIEFVFQDLAKREVVLTDQVVGEVVAGFPMMSMWKGFKTKKYKSEMTESEYLLELETSQKILFNILLSLPEKPITVLGNYRPSMKLRPRSLGVIQKGDKYLAFIKNYGNSAGKITWVGGGVDFGELPVEALMREVKEELGYTEVKILKDLGCLNHFYETSEYGVAAMTFGFLIEVLDYNKIEAEIDDGRYSLVELTKQEFLEKSEISVAVEFLKRV
jgi:8-oxo-dGTP pyrophosphatase MutT (NUDIX family)